MLLSENFILPHQNIVHLKSIFKTDERKKGIALNRIYETIDNFDAICKDKKESIKLELFKQILFSNTVGNYDLNYGNIAFLSNQENEIIDLSPAYDITCTYVFDESTKSSIIVNGKRKDVEAIDILTASMHHLNNLSLFNASRNILKGIKDNIVEIENSYMEKEDISFIYDYVKERIDLLSTSIDTFMINSFKEINPEYKLLTINEFNAKLSQKIESQEELENKYSKFLELELNTLKQNYNQSNINDEIEKDNSLDI